MKSPLPNSQMSALAYLYDHARDLPRWFGQLTARQLKDVAELMIHWSAATENRGILPMEEIERREVLRAVVMCEGNISKAAKLLNIGKTTAYRKLMQWGYSVQNRMLIEQTSALSRTSEAQPEDSHKSE
jgi:DNA-binding NtrC family response regulator